MTREELAARLGIPASQVTARGLLDHEFPGVVDCIPAGPSRDAFVNGLGNILLQQGLADSTEAGDTFRYEGQITAIRRVLSEPEMQGLLERCRRSNPQPSGGSTGPDGGDASGPGGIRPVHVVLTLVALGAVGGLLYLTMRGAPPTTPRASNPPARPERRPSDGAVRRSSRRLQGAARA